MQVNIYDAKTQLSQLVERAMAGEEVVIAKAGKAMVKLTPVREPGERVLGAASGRYQLAEGWERAMNDAEYGEFSGEGEL